jgi:hypothetical protein
MSVHLGQLRKWHHPVEGQSDYFIVVRRIGKFVPNGSRAGASRTDHWELLYDGQISTGWPEDLIMEESVPCNDIT